MCRGFQPLHRHTLYKSPFYYIYNTAFSSLRGLAGGRADLDRWDGAHLARSRAVAGAEPAVRRWVRERKMQLGWNRPAAAVPLDPEQALDTWQRLGITFDLFTTMHDESHRSCGWLVAGALASAGAVLVGVYKINASKVWAWH